MRAVVIEEFGVVPHVRDVPDLQPPPGSVVIAVEATGLCRSDWHAFIGHDPDVVLPHVPGHEFAGTVRRVGAGVAEATGVAVGDRVTAPFVLACGECEQCRAGDHQVCVRQVQPGFTRWGSFADEVVVERAAVNLVRVPHAVDMAAAAILGCRFATSFRALHVVGRLRAGEWLAVHGCGGVGLSAVMIAVAAGSRVVAVDTDPAALALAAGFGAEHTVDATGLRPEEVAAAVRQVTSGGTQLSMDALGSEATCGAAIAGLRPRGRHVQVGLLPPHLGVPRVPMHLVVAHELEVLGSHGMAADAYPELLEMVGSGRLQPARLITRTIGLHEVGHALAQLPESAAGICLVRPGQAT